MLESTKPEVSLHLITRETESLTLDPVAEMLFTSLFLM